MSWHLKLSKLSETTINTLQRSGKTLGLLSVV